MVKIKGSVIIDAMKWVREHHGQDRFDRIISLLGPEAKNMFQQPILSFHWCSFDAYIEFLEICLREEWKGDTNWIVNSAEDIVKK
jgi:hypothetical protein